MTYKKVDQFNKSQYKSKLKSSVEDGTFYWFKMFTHKDYFDSLFYCLKFELSV
jgi:hypothetical protein